MKEEIIIIDVTKTEAEAIRKRFPKAHVRRTMVKRSKRHHYCAEESRGVMKLLNEMRGGGVTYEHLPEENISSRLI